MDIRELKLFIETAHAGSFAAVARAHDIDPSSVSRTIAGLETELGIRLFHRTTRKLSLTESGDIYLRQVEPLVEGLSRAGDEALAVSTGPTGILRLTCSVAFGYECIMPIAGEFREEFPNLKLELLATDSNIDLVTERVDLAIRMAPSIDANLIGTKLMQTRYRVCASPEYISRYGQPASPSELSNHSCLLLMLPEYRTRWLFKDKSGRMTEVPVSGNVEVSNPLTLKAGALSGHGPTLLANWLVDRHLTSGELVDLFPDHEVTATTLGTAAWLLYPSRTYLPNKVRVTIDFLKRKFARFSPNVGKT
ncbi:MAG: LysR family transcriptional regulator [Methyloligellaceae bacterium]